MTPIKKKAIYFDRDGTLIVDKVYLNDPNQIEYIPGVFDSLKILRDLDFVFFVVTNQSGIPRGLVDPKNLFEIHRRMKAEFSRHGIDILEFYYAPYMTDYDHPMRKPNPGMILTAASEYSINLSQSWMVGDKDVDIEAGHRAGCKSILVGDKDFKFNVAGDKNLKTTYRRGPEVILPSIANVGQYLESKLNSSENPKGNDEIG